MKITLRELFLLTLIAALCLGWWLDHVRKQHEQVQLQAELKVQSSNVSEICQMLEQIGLKTEIKGQAIDIRGEIGLDVSLSGDRLPPAGTAVFMSGGTPH